MSSIVINVAPAGSDVFKKLQWNRVHIKKSLDEICHSLTLELPISQKDLLHKHDTIEVRFYNKHITHNNGNLRVTTVRIDEITDTTDSGRKYITVLAARLPVILSIQRGRAVPVSRSLGGLTIDCFTL